MTAKGIISFNGIRSDQFGIGVENYPKAVKPVRKMDRYTVPGRNGDILMMQDAWENVKQSYDIFAGDMEKQSVHDNFTDIASWLCAPKGYCELWDDFDPNHFRMAILYGSFDVEALAAGSIGRTTITFDCKPQRYLFSGKSPVEFIRAPGKIWNPTAYQAKPLIFVTRSSAGSGTVTVGNNVFTVSALPENGLYIDCEKMECYDSNGTNANSMVSSSSSEFGGLNPGNNSIGFTGAVNKVAITPRWFDI